MTSATLGSALDQLVEVALSAGLDGAAARLEGEQLAAAVSEPAVGAYVEWSQQTGRQPNAHDYFAAASKGRKFRVGPTPLMSQLANTLPDLAQSYASALVAVISSASTLGEPTPQVAGLAATAASAQSGAIYHPGAAAPVGSISNLDGVPGNTGGLNPELLDRLQQSQERLKAMDDFTRIGDAAFSAVLDQLQVNQAKIAEMRNSPMFNVPGGPGLDTTGSTGAPGGTSVEPVETSDPQPGVAAAAPVETSEAIAEAPPERTVDELLAELDELIGLAEVKAEIKRQAAILAVQSKREAAGLKVPTITRHLVFVGNPGTGKTTVARLVAGIYKALGLLSKGQLVEVDRSELVAGYLGQTALKTAEVSASALGGVLFIDEAYALSGDQYGEEAINTLVKEMEDNRNDLVVIVAGYPAPMAKFIAENPGLTSRFRTTIEFANYTDQELVDIFIQMVAKADYDLAEGALAAFERDLARQVKDATFGNGRYCRNMLEAAIGQQAWRLRDEHDPTIEQLRTLLPEDILSGEALNPGDELLPPEARTPQRPGSEDDLLANANALLTELGRAAQAADEAAALAGTTDEMPEDAAQDGRADLAADADEPDQPTGAQS